jgi:WD40 repeat protein
MKLIHQPPYRDSVNITQALRQREYRKHTRQQPSKIQEQWYRSQRSVQTLGFWVDLEGHQGCVNTINFSKSGDLLVSGSDDTTVKIWNVETQRCLDTLRGHISNVFAADFLPYRSNKEIVTGGNDADMRHYDLEKKVCTVYCHHKKKVLRITINPHAPDTFLSCSADGTIRMIDVRKSYGATRQHTFEEYSDGNQNDYVIPQAFGGGRVQSVELENEKDALTSSLVLDYHKGLPASSRRRVATSTLFSVDFHPDGNRFIVGSAQGDVRLYDIRKIIDHDHRKSHIAIYGHLPANGCYEITGCVFSKDGSEIVTTTLKDFIYLYDTESKTGSTEPAAKVRKTEKGEEPCRSPDSDQKQEPPTAEKSYKNVYRGHCSSRTIKAVNFYGPNSEFVISGSDDAIIYIWDKKTAELLTILEGHDDIVNCIIGHPTQPLIASSGIDNVVKLWQNVEDYPTEEVLQHRKKRQKEIADFNIYDTQETETQTICVQQ